VLESEAEHDFIIQVLTDSMGFSSVIDRIGIGELSIEGEEVAADAPEEEDELDVRLFYDRGVQEEAFDAKGNFPLVNFEEVLFS
jgi:hypothetical protein